MTEEQKKRLEQRLRELAERLNGKPVPTVKESTLLTELQPGYRSWHSFRHTHATLLTEVGESIKTTQSILGHSNLNTTLKYSHPIPESQRRAIKRVAEILDPNGLMSGDSTNTQRFN